MKSLTDWCKNNHQPFSRQRTCKGDPDAKLSKDRPRFSFMCENGDNHSRKNPKATKRTVQRTLFTGCTSVINVRLDADKFWRIKKCDISHVNKDGSISHVISPEMYANYNTTKKKYEEVVKSNIVKLKKVNAPSKEIADDLLKETGCHFTTKDILNRAQKYETDIKEGKNVKLEDYLHDIISGHGSTKGKVFAKYDENKLIRVLTISTAVQQEELKLAKPKVFYADTTFGTNAEQYKVHLPTYESPLTGKTEIACYIFLATETQNNVRDGLKSWKLCLPYDVEDVGGMFYIFIDKDFSSKKELELVFTCIVLLCLVHVSRYWREKMLPSAIEIKEDGSQVGLSGINI